VPLSFVRRGLVSVMYSYLTSSDHLSAHITPGIVDRGRGGDLGINPGLRRTVRSILTPQLGENLSESRGSMGHTLPWPCGRRCQEQIRYIYCSEQSHLLCSVRSRSCLMCSITWYQCLMCNTRRVWVCQTTVRRCARHMCYLDRLMVTGSHSVFFLMYNNMSI